jgi:hypothetical protein
VQRAQHLDELRAEPVLEGDPARLDPPRNQQHLLVLHVDALDRSDTGGECDDLGLVDGREQLVGGVPGEHVGQSRLNADADQGQPSGLRPLWRGGELFVSELDATRSVRLCGVRPRQRHGHVEVVGARREGVREHGSTKRGVDRVEHVRDPELAAQPRDVLCGRGIHPYRLEAMVGAVDRAPRAVEWTRSATTIVS